MSSGTDADLASQLGGDLVSLIRDVDAPLVEVTVLSGRGYPGYEPSAFRLRFADGRVLKGRRFARAPQAKEVEDILRQLCGHGLPAVVARAGAALLTEWIDGQGLNAATWTAEVLRQCGALQGSLHSVPVSAAHRRTPSRVIGRWHSNLQRQLTQLAAAGALEPGEAHTSFAIAARCAPSSCTVGYIHGDFCPENLVLQPSGEVGVVDNETLSIDAHDYDLGRTWYRWPIQVAQREAYLEGYNCYRSAAGFLQHFPFWAIAGVVAGAVFRLEKHASASSVPINRLRALVRDAERGVSPETAALHW